MTSFDPDALSSDYSFLARQLEMVGDRDPIEILEGTPDALDAAMADVTRARANARPRPDAWSAAGVIGHLLDIEWLFGHRARTVLCEEDPVLVEMDHERWVDVQRHVDADPGVLLSSFRGVRRATVAFWRAVPDHAWDRSARHPGAGIPYSLGFMLRLQAGHDLAHLLQLDRTLSPTSPGA